MKNFRLAVATSIAVAVTVLSSGAAHAYPDSPNVTISIPDSTLVGGKVVTFTARAEVECDWTASFPGGHAAGESATQSGSGESFSGSYLTKAVDADLKVPLTVTCAYDSSQVAAAAAKAPSVKDATASASATITLLPAGSSDGESGSGRSDDNGALPDTGGSNVWILALGGVLIVAGGGAVVASRRRHTSR